MSRVLAIFGLVLAVQGFGRAQGTLDGKQAPPSQNPFQLVWVPEEQTRIEERTLIGQPEVMGSAQSQTLPGSYPTGENSGMTDRTADTPNAFRCYAMVLAPGECLKLRLKGATDSKIFMKFLPKSATDKMTSQVRRANMSPAPARASRIEITNITDGPYQVALMLYGQANYPYILELDRKKK